MTRNQKEVPLASISGDEPPVKKDVVYEADGTAWTIRKDPLAGLSPFQLRHHHDGLEDIVSMQTGTLNTDPSETRTEFAAEADINNILERYSAGQMPMQRQLKYGETIDYSMGLQEALHAVGDMEALHRQTVPPELMNVYPTWREWINAAANGSYEHELANLAEKKAAKEQAAKPAEEPPKNPPEGKKE